MVCLHNLNFTHGGVSPVDEAILFKIKHVKPDYKPDFVAFLSFPECYLLYIFAFSSSTTTATDYGKRVGASRNSHLEICTKYIYVIYIYTFRVKQNIIRR